MSDALVLMTCSDCLIGVANADYTGMDLKRETAVRIGIARWNNDGFWLAPGDGTDDDPFSWSSCDVCLTPLAGFRHQMWAMDLRQGARPEVPSPPESPDE